MYVPKPYVASIFLLIVLLCVGVAWLVSRDLGNALREAELKACINTAAMFQLEMARKSNTSMESLLKDAEDFDSRQNSTMTIFVALLRQGK